MSTIFGVDPGKEGEDKFAVLKAEADEKGNIKVNVDEYEPGMPSDLYKKFSTCDNCGHKVMKLKGIRAWYHYRLGSYKRGCFTPGCNCVTPEPKRF